MNPTRSVHLLRSALPALWNPATPDVVAAMVPPRRAVWLVGLRLPVRDLVARLEVAGIVGVARAPGGLAIPIALREVESLQFRHFALRTDLGAEFAFRLIRLHDRDPEDVALTMLRDWQHGALFSDRLIFSDLIH